jgi:hypothetical protein
MHFFLVETVELIKLIFSTRKKDKRRMSMVWVLFAKKKLFRSIERGSKA